MLYNPIIQQQPTTKLEKMGLRQLVEFHDMFCYVTSTNQRWTVARYRI